MPTSEVQAKALQDEFDRLFADCMQAIEASKNFNEETLKINVIQALDRHFRKFGINLGEFVEYESDSIGTTFTSFVKVPFENSFSSQGVPVPP